MKNKLNKYLLLFSFVILLYGSTVTISETNTSCGSCHSDQKLSWEKSTHVSINCIDCHIEPGIEGAIKAQIQGVKDLYVSITRGNDLTPHDDPLPISSENCRGCHAGILYYNEMAWEDLPDNSLKGQGLKMSHRLHIETAKLDCVDCHRGITHRDPEIAGKYKTNWPLMHTDCGRCHNGNLIERFNKTLTDVDDITKKSCISCHPYFIDNEK